MRRRRRQKKKYIKRTKEQKLVTTCTVRANASSETVVPVAVRKEEGWGEAGGGKTG